MKLGLFIVCALPMLADGSTDASDRTDLPASLRGIGIEQKLNAPVPLDTEFRDETGASVPLRTYFGTRPVLLAPVYYTCPMLCSQILTGLVAGLRPLSLKPGRDFEIVAISINPSETPADSSSKRDQYSRRYSSKAGPQGWHFLTGSEQSIRTVMDAIGFHYRWDPKIQMFVHASGVMVLSPLGRVSRYFYGVEYEPKDLKLGLIEASNNTIGSPVDQILLFCYHYDPATGKYGATVINLLRFTAILALMTFATALFLLWRRDVRADRQTFLKEARR